ncbi:natural cytotoxicity triggering receptor 2 [Echinops telfairi]|uniref:Natural cytotoxicity triggering receptor 2 n=1 Tax=Echinops telfairi TaxID=9371 RepID=A0AC55DG34_ECHTE|nr:natural cytotoxicity triggering receptor 2 [Echinops telfairi]
MFDILFQEQGSRTLAEVKGLQYVAGQTLKVKCQYPPQRAPYERKGWCKGLSLHGCLKLVSTSEPQTQTQASRFTIWDNPSAGFFTVVMADLREEDSGHYWCRNYPTSRHSASRSMKFYISVSAAPAKTSRQTPPRALSTAFTRTTWHQVPAQTWSSLAPIGAATIALSEYPSALSSNVLVAVLCGQLTAKLLGLAVLLVL